MVSQGGYTLYDPDKDKGTFVIPKTEWSVQFDGKGGMSIFPARDNCYVEPPHPSCREDEVRKNRVILPNASRHWWDCRVTGRDPE